MMFGKIENGRKQFKHSAYIPFPIQEPIMKYGFLAILKYEFLATWAVCTRICIVIFLDVSLTVVFEARINSLKQPKILTKTIWKPLCYGDSYENNILEDLLRQEAKSTVLLEQIGF